MSTWPGSTPSLEQDKLETACLVLQEMFAEAGRPLLNGRPKIVEFSRRFMEIHPQTSIVERKRYFDAFMGNESHTPTHSLETGGRL